MLSQIMRKLGELSLFLAVLFSFMFMMLIAADNDSLINSFNYYFWIVVPLAVIGLLLGGAKIVYQAIRDHYGMKKTGIGS